ncbi:MAG: acetylxylan esterase [Lentisphaeria bacterium]|nr:acetylxylan esterase [Lentisphaeria bacterium]
MFDQHNGIYGALLQEYNVERIRQLNRERDARLEALKTRDDALAYIADVRAKIASAFALPERTGVPAAKITGIIDTPECRIEKIIYESRPGFPVTAHLMIPKNLSAPAPACLFLCGHAQEGKASAAYQTGARTLAANGFVTLLVDPVSQGERYQFTKVANNFLVNGSCTREHNMLGKQMWLCGEFFGSWRAHDALSGLDYLLSRPEVDRSKVAVTGNSGGGTMTSFVQALDERFTMAAPSCYITSWQRNIENELPADAEQLPPGILASGCEMGDLILAYAPRPILLMGQKNDFFDPRGLEETFEKCRQVYKLLGAEENIKMFIGPGDHGYSVENRFAMYEFFSRHASTAAISAEADISIPAGETLKCTVTGQVADLPGTKMVRDLIAEKAAQLRGAREKLDLAGVKDVLINEMKFPESAVVPYCRNLRQAFGNENNSSGFVFSRFGMETDKGIITPVLLKGPELVRTYFHFPRTEEMTLYIPHLSSADELSKVTASGMVAGIDIRGIGETRSWNCDFHGDNFFHIYGADYHYNGCSIMFGTSLLHERLRDILGVIAYIESIGIKNIRLIGRGQGAVAALFAALLSEKIASVKLIDAPESFESMALAGVTLWPHAVMPFGILRYTDLPEIYELMRAAGKLEIVNFADNLMQQVY